MIKLLLQLDEMFRYPWLSFVAMLGSISYFCIATGDTKVVMLLVCIATAEKFLLDILS